MQDDHDPNYRKLRSGNRYPLPRFVPVLHVNFNAEDLEEFAIPNNVQVVVQANNDLEMAQPPAAPPVINPPPVSAAHKPPTFSGLSTENGSEFLRLFELYCRIHGLHLTEPVPIPNPPRTQPACFRFQANITGQAAAWFSSLAPANVHTWPLIRALFVAKYCNLVNDWAENVNLKNTKQGLDDPVEAYIVKFSDQATRMGKDLDECVSEFVNGLIPEIQANVILHCPANFEAAARHAKLAELVHKKRVPVVNQISSQIPENPEMIELITGLKEATKLLTEAVKPVTSNSSSDNVDSESAVQNLNTSSGQGFNRSFRGRNNFGRGFGRPNNQNVTTRIPNRFPGYCLRCGIYGHRARDCRRNVPGRGFYRNNSPVAPQFGYPSPTYNLPPANAYSSSNQQYMHYGAPATPVTRPIMPPRTHFAQLPAGPTYDNQTPQITYPASESGDSYASLPNSQQALN